MTSQIIAKNNYNDNVNLLISTYENISNELFEELSSKITPIMFNN